MHSSIPRSEASVLLDLPIKFAMKLDGSAARDVHERERCEDVNENRCSRFCFLVSLHDEIETSVSREFDFFFLRDEFVVAAREEPYMLSIIPARLDVVVCRTVLRAVILPNIVFRLAASRARGLSSIISQCVFVFFQRVQTLPKLTCHLI